MNPTVGALSGNASRMVNMAREAFANGASLIMFPELALTGYPPEDLVLKRHFLEDCKAQIDRLAEDLPTEPVIIAGAPWHDDGRIYNSAVIFNRGRICAVYHKINLPNYGVFDEKRLFQEGDKPLVLQAGDISIGVHICEDAWYDLDRTVLPLDRAGVDLIVNISASPYHREKRSVRENVIRKIASTTGIPLLYCNITGGQDEIVFDGGSMALDGNGKLVARGRFFKEEIVYASMPVNCSTANTWDFSGCMTATVSFPAHESFQDKQFTPSGISPVMDDHEEIYTALVTGMRDYADKNGFEKTVIALSGGLDSALVAVIAVDAMGSDRVTSVTMPSHFTSDETLNDALELSRNLGIECHKIPIVSIYNAFLSELSILWKNREEDVAEENLQSRIRGNIIMALSNKDGALVLTTGNKSELATGYCTLYGDMAGGFSVIKDVLKTLVFDIARWRNSQGGNPVIPQTIIDRPPSAELKPGQRDSDTLPPYEILDAIIERYVERYEGIEEIIKHGLDPETVKRVVSMIDHNEYKRRQGPPGSKITGRAFGRDRRIPITNAYRERV